MLAFIPITPKNQINITKHTCKHCHQTYYTLGNTVSPDCPFHYTPNSQFYNQNYTSEEDIQLYKLRQELVGKKISIDEGLIIILEVLELHSKSIEFILMPSHRIYTTTLDYLYNNLSTLTKNQNS